MSIQTELQRIVNAKQTLAEKAVEMGLFYVGDDTQDVYISLNEDGTPKNKIEEIADAFDFIKMKGDEDLSASGKTVSVPAGYYPNGASKDVAVVEQATPVVSFDSSTGLVTANATQTAGYVTAGTKSGTKQLTSATGCTIVPNDSEQTAAHKGVFTLGDIIVAPIPEQYVDITSVTKDSDDLSASGAKVTVPAGYYPNGAEKSVTNKGEVTLTPNSNDETTFSQTVNGYVTTVTIDDAKLEEALAAI